MIFTAQRTMIIKEFQSLDSLHVQKTKLTFIHTPGKKMDIVVQLGLELTDAQADYSAFSGHMTLGLHAMVIKRGNNCDAFEKHF